MKTPKKHLIRVLLVVAISTSAGVLYGAGTASPAEAVAVLNPTAGQKCRGVVRFTEAGDSVKVVADVEGLTPGQKHAFHIHQYGDCTSSDGMSAGGHYNPEGHQHGLPDADVRHAGDLGNLQADDQGKAHYELTVKNISVMGANNPIVGRGVVVHAKFDDGGQPVGNAGGRIACGAIGIANPGK
jgi:superoxide dismutase, Cu-Zn family